MAPQVVSGEEMSYTDFLVAYDGVHADGTYHEMALGNPPVLRCEALPGMWIAVDWIWRQPFPKQKVVLKEWGLV